MHTKARKQKEVDLKKNSIADYSDFVVDAKNIDFSIPFQKQRVSMLLENNTSTLLKYDVVAQAIIDHVASRVLLKLQQIFDLNQLYVATSTFIDQQMILDLSVLTEADICTQLQINLLVLYSSFLLRRTYLYSAKI